MLSSLVDVIKKRIQSKDTLLLSFFYYANIIGPKFYPATDLGVYYFENSFTNQYLGPVNHKEICKEKLESNYFWGLIHM